MNITKTHTQIRIEYEYMKNGYVNIAEIYINKYAWKKGYQFECRACDFPELENFSAETWEQVKAKILASEKDVENFRQGLENTWKYISEVIV